MHVGFRTVNPFGLRRETRLGGWLRRRRHRTPLHALTGESDKTPLPEINKPDPIDAAPVGGLPLQESHHHEALRWNLRAVAHSLRHRTIVGKLARIDRRVISAVARRTHRVERELLTATDFGDARSARRNFAAGAAGREDELERSHRRRSLLVTCTLVLFDASMMVGPWHLFGAPPIPALPSSHARFASSAFAIGRALLLSTAIVLTAKRAGMEARILIGDNARAARFAGATLLTAIGLTTVLLLHSAAEMQAVYLGLLTGGTGTTLPASVFLLVMLFVVCASLANGYWNTSLLAERHGRLLRVETRSRRRWERAAKRLDAIDGRIRRLLGDRTHVLDALRELVREQTALEQVSEAQLGANNWMLFGLTPPHTATENVDTAAADTHPTDAAVDTGAFESEPPIGGEQEPVPLRFPRSPRFADEPVPAAPDQEETPATTHNDNSEADGAGGEHQPDLPELLEHVRPRPAGSSDHADDAAGEES